MVASCSNLELDLQDNPNQVTPENAGLEFLFNSIQVDFADAIWEAYDESAGFARMMAMTGGNSYDNADTPNNFNFFWRETYANLLPDIESIFTLTAGNVGVDFPNGVAKTLKAYAMMTLVDVFGDVPFNDALKGSDSQNPVLDDDAAVYAASLELLNQAKGHFQAAIDNDEDVSGLVDVFYGGSSAQWIKAVNSLIIRYHVTTKLAGGSGSAVKSLADGGSIITDVADDFDFHYSAARNVTMTELDSRQDYYQIDFETGATYYQSNYFMWSLIDEKGVEDPRLKYYFYRQDCDLSDEDAFTLDCPTIPRPAHYTGDYPWCVADFDLGYWGRDHGNNDGIPPDTEKRTVFGVYPAGGKFDDGSCASATNGGTAGLKGAGLLPIISAATTNFLRAEAALTMGSGEDAKALLEAGVRASITKVLDFGAGEAGDMAPTQEDIDTYVNIVLNNYDAAADNNAKLNVVMKEYHIAAFGNGLDAYNNYRRTGMPLNMQPTRDPNSGTFPRLLFYPADHVVLNINGSQRSLDEQVFWDTNPAGFIK